MNKTILLVLLQFSVVSFGQNQSLQDKRPNVIIIFTDDQGYQDLGCYGSPDIKTPHLDKMAQNGIRLTDFYAAQAVCSASRAGLLTGCYPNR
ncbi:MAG: arylsulfatase, partial [Bacteroidetes bacterium]